MHTSSALGCVFRDGIPYFCAGMVLAFPGNSCSHLYQLRGSTPILFNVVSCSVRSAKLLHLDVRGQNLQFVPEVLECLQNKTAGLECKINIAFRRGRKQAPTAWLVARACTRPSKGFNCTSVSGHTHATRRRPPGRTCHLLRNSLLYLL